MTIPTLPPGHTPDFNAGWAAAIAAIQAPPVTPPPAPAQPAAPVANVPLSADLCALLNTAPANAVYVLTAGTYQMNGTPTIKSAGVKLNLNGARLDLFPPPGATSDIVVRAANFEMFGGTIGRGVVVCRTYAEGTSLHDLKILGVDPKVGTGINTLLIADIGGSNAKVTHCEQLGPCNSVLVYWMADNMAVTLNTFSEGSLGEDVLRSDCDQNGRHPLNAIISKNPILANPHNAYHKEVIAVRMGSATIEDNPSITPALAGGDAVRAGEKTATAVAQFATVAITRNGFPAVSPGYPQISIVQGVLANIEANVMAADAAQQSITVDGFSSVVAKNNVRRRTVKGAAVKPALIAAAPGQTPVIAESGTTIVDP